MEELHTNPTKGTPIGHSCYKIRLAIKSKGKGKSGRARVITYYTVQGNKLSFFPPGGDGRRQTAAEVLPHRLRLLQTAVCCLLSVFGDVKTGIFSPCSVYYIHGSTVYLLSIYDKAERESISEAKIAELLLGIKASG